MKAWVVREAGGPDVLELRDVEPVTPAADEVSIRVRAFGLNQAEVYRRKGVLGPIEGVVVPGIEAVGEVIEDPSGTFAAGERVATAMGGLQFDRTGSYAEQVTVARANVVSLTGIDLSWPELAALPQSYLTAWGAVDRALGLGAGDALLVRGATAALGLATVSYAHFRGITVVAAVRSGDDTALVQSLGADHVITDGGGSLAEAVAAVVPVGVDGALDVVGGGTILGTAAAVRPLGRTVIVGLLAGPPVIENLDLTAGLPAGSSVGFFPSQLLGTPTLELAASPLAEIARGVAVGEIPSMHGQTFPFTDVPKAHELLESHRAPGKIVVEL